MGDERCKHEPTDKNLVNTWAWLFLEPTTPVTRGGGWGMSRGSDKDFYTRSDKREACGPPNPPAFPRAPPSGLAALNCVEHKPCRTWYMYCGLSRCMHYSYSIKACRTARTNNWTRVNHFAQREQNIAYTLRQCRTARKSKWYTV